MKSTMVRWMGHVACIGVRRNEYRILLGKHEGKTALGRLGIDGSPILKPFLKKWDMNL
jgi:hypothetical protein